MLNELAKDFRSRAATYRTQAKAYRNRSNEQAALTKGAAVWELAANLLEGALHAEAPNTGAQTGDAQHVPSEAGDRSAARRVRTGTRRQTVASTGGDGEAAGQVHVPDVRSSDSDG